MSSAETAWWHINATNNGIIKAIVSFLEKGCKDTKFRVGHFSQSVAQ